MRRMCVLVLFAVPMLAFANEANDMLQQMPDAKRNTALAMFMQRSGERCASVTRNFYQGTDKAGDAFWNVTCSDGKSWSIMIHNDAGGSTKILDCATLKALGTSCFKRFR